jgi:pilin isopeptide linkage protein
MSFSTLYFDEPGEYIYTISEEKGMLDSVVYDESVYTIKINVTKQEDGSFNLETEFIKNGLETQSIDFTNEYKTRDFTAKKMWEVPADVTVADGAKHPEIELQLLRDGKPYGDDVTINPNDPDSFTTQENTFTWEKLPMYRADYALDTQTGERLESVYTVKEVHVPDNYFMGMEDEDQTVRNVYWPNARAVHKIWDGGMPEAGT